MSFKFPYKHPLCILIFMYSIYKALSKDNSNNNLKLDLSDFDSIQKFINEYNLAGSANANTNKLCISSNLVFKMNKRTNVKVEENKETNQHCIEYDIGDNSYINNPERRYKGNLDSKIKEWIDQMSKEYIQSNDNKCETYSGKKCIYINGTDKENQLKLPLRSLLGYCKGGKPIRWYENTTITCSLKQKTTNINGKITIENGIIKELKLEGVKNNVQITITKGTIITNSTSTGENGTITITEGTITIKDNTITDGTITSADGTITIKDNTITVTGEKVESATITSIMIEEGSFTDYGQNLNNLIQCCRNRNENSSLFIGNAKVTCDDDKTTSDDVVDVKIWADDKGNISNTSTISCKQNIGDGNKLTINVIFSENKKK